MSVSTLTVNLEPLAAFLTAARTHALATTNGMARDCWRGLQGWSSKDIAQLLLDVLTRHTPFPPEGHLIMPLEDELARRLFVRRPTMKYHAFVRSQLFGCVTDALGPVLSIKQRFISLKRRDTILLWNGPPLPSALPRWPWASPTSEAPQWSRKDGNIVGTLNGVPTDFIHQNGPNAHTGHASEASVSDIDLQATNSLSSIRFCLNAPVINVLTRLLEQNELPNKKLLREKKTADRQAETEIDLERFSQEHDSISQATPLQDAEILLAPPDYSRLKNLRDLHRNLTNTLTGCHALRESLFDCLKWAQHQGASPFSFLHYRDWRLRSYASGNCWNYQGNDLQSTLLFTEHRPLGPAGWERLRGYLGGVAGDKKDWPERMAWTRDHHADILAVATDPLRHLSLWNTWDEPVKALAAAFEYAAAFASGTPETFPSALPIGLDATTSVAQHLVLLLRYAPLAPMVNLIDGASRGDLYHHVLTCAVAKVRALHPGYGLEIPELTRLMAKRVVMTGLYGSPKMKQFDRIQSLLVEDGFDPKAHEIDLLAKALWDALQEVLPMLKTIQSLLTRIARIQAKAGKFMTWRTPTDSTIQQAYWETEPSRLSCTYKGKKVTLKAMLERPGSGFKSRQWSAITANFIHSLDASIVTLAVNDCFASEFPCYTTHDCFYSHAATSNRMYEIVRNAYVKVHAGSPLLSNFFAHTVPPKGYPSPPSLGTLSLEEVSTATRILI